MTPPPDSRPGRGLLRRRAIRCALWYGFIPSRFYEETPHHDAGYWRHLGLNLVYAVRWLTFRETTEDIEFERRVNA